MPGTVWDTEKVERTVYPFRRDLEIRLPSGITPGGGCVVVDIGETVIITPFYFLDVRRPKQKPFIIRMTLYTEGIVGCVGKGCFTRGDISKMSHS